MADKKITLIHSNDIHGDFLEVEKDGVKTGGIARLSGYLKQKRAEDKNVIYAIAGDMFKGSIIDSEYLGMSTIELVNQLYPDVVTLGNHEVDYGIAHLLFIEKCTHFPIINANMFIKTNHTRLFNPYEIIEKDGIRIMFIGIITQEVLAMTKTENVIGTFVDAREAAREVGVICDTYKTTDIDYTVILSHVGLEEDIKMAEMLPKEAGVDLIIGGHTHTLMEEPMVVNGIPIVQAGCGTDQVGEAELLFDEATKALKGFSWKTVPITESLCPIDEQVAGSLDTYKNETDEKYAQIITTFARQLTHPARNQETELGNLFADVMQDGSSFDIMLLASGSMRKKELGPVLRVQDFKEFFPYDDALHMIEVTGAELRKMISYMLREEAFSPEGHTEFYQFSKDFRVVWSRSKQAFEAFTFKGEEIRDDQMLKIALQNYHFNNFDDIFNLPMAPIVERHPARTVGGSICGIYEELLSSGSNFDAVVDGRITVKE